MNEQVDTEQKWEQRRGRRLTDEERAALRQRYRGQMDRAWPGVADIERCLDALDASEAENALRAERDGLLRVSEAQVEMYHHLETTFQEARDLLEEATGYADTSGHYYAGSGTASTAAPLTESLLGRIIIFLQRTEGGE